MKRWTKEKQKRTLKERKRTITVGTSIKIGPVLFREQNEQNVTNVLYTTNFANGYKNQTIR